jgi:hypothetical protein
VAGGLRGCCLYGLGRPEPLDELFILIIPLFHLCIGTPRSKLCGGLRQFRCDILCGRHGGGLTVGNVLKALNGDGENIQVA